MKNFRQLKVICVRFCLSTVVLAAMLSSANAEFGEELRILQMFYKDSDLAESSSRYPKSISRIADNITIVTADDIKSINAHTVAEVLLHVTGVQTAILGSPGSLASVQIQGSENRQVLVIIDGVTQNNLADGVADVGALPVQNIERIEIVKGPASSSWGSSLGGVISIITKSPDGSREIGGTASASIGSNNTGDYRAELSGKTGDLGYYLNGGGLTTDGFQPHNSFYGGNLYSKLSWSPSDKTDMTFGLGYIRGNRAITEVQNADSGISFDGRSEYLYSSISLRHTFTDEISADASLKFMHRDILLKQNIAPAEPEADVADKEHNYGGSLKFAWQRSFNQLVAGTDFDLGRLDAGNVIMSGGQNQTKFVSEDLNRVAFYANDTLSFRQFSIIPGIRYDYTSTNGDFVSPSLGITCEVAKNTVLRGYVARGFNIPPLGSTIGTGFFSVPNPGLKMEEVLSYSVGLETAELKYVWLKTTLFRHDVDDALVQKVLSSDPHIETTVNGGRQRRQGVEAEAKSMPVFDTSLMAGYAFIDAVDRDTGRTLADVPKYTVDVGLQYDNSKYFRGNLKGHYVWWNTVPQQNGKYTAMIWDLNLAKTFHAGEKSGFEVFFTAHNIFNGSQYPLGIYKNPKRWFEGGLRFEF